MSETPSGGPEHKPGELVLLEYDLWAEGGGRTELLDTTHREVADEQRFSLPPGLDFGPRPHLLGGDEFPPALEQTIASAPAGKDVEREFAPAEAFGERDPRLIELFSMHEIERLPEMRRENAELAIGTVLTIRGRRGRVTTLTAARVRVDFNPPQAGKKVRAKFKVVEPITDTAEKARALVDLAYGHGKEFDVTFHEKVLTVRLPVRAKFDLFWHTVAKPKLIERLRNQLHPKAIHFVEEHVTPVEPKPAEPAKAKAPAAASSAEAVPEEGGEAAEKPAHGTGAKGHRPKAAEKTDTAPE